MRFNLETFEEFKKSKVFTYLFDLNIYYEIREIFRIGRLRVNVNYFTFKFTITVAWSLIMRHISIIEIKSTTGVGMNWNLVGTRYLSVPNFWNLLRTRLPAVLKILKFRWVPGRLSRPGKAQHGDFQTGIRKIGPSRRPTLAESQLLQSCWQATIAQSYTINDYHSQHTK